MNHILQCPTCTKPFQVLAEHAGTRVKCPSCEQVVAIPEQLPSEPTRVPEPPKPRRDKSETVSLQIVFGCPDCSGEFGVTSEMFDLHVACPHCSATVLVQDPDPDPDPDPAKDTALSKRKTKQRPPKNPQPEKSTVESSPEEGAPNSVPDGNEKQLKAKPRWKREDVSSSDLFAPGHRVDASGEKPTLSMDSTDVPPDETSKSKIRSSATSQLLEEPAPPRPAENEKKPVDHLLPPRFEVLDPNAIRIKVSDDDNKVFLPDGKGGVKRVDNRVVRVTHDGEEIQLMNSTDAEKARRRLITNLVTISVLLLTLLLVFIVLRKYL